MFAKPTDLAEYRNEKQKQQLKGYLARCYSIQVFFGHAYQDAYMCHDRHEVQCRIEQYERTGEIPDFVLAYMRKLI